MKMFDKIVSSSLIIHGIVYKFNNNEYGSRDCSYNLNKWVTLMTMGSRDCSYNINNNEIMNNTDDNGSRDCSYNFNNNEIMNNTEDNGSRDCSYNYN